MRLFHRYTWADAIREAHRRWAQRFAAGSVIVGFSGNSAWDAFRVVCAQSKHQSWSKYEPSRGVGLTVR